MKKNHFELFELQEQDVEHEYVQHDLKHDNAKVAVVTDGNIGALIKRKEVNTKGCVSFSGGWEIYSLICSCCGDKENNKKIFKAATELCERKNIQTVILRDKYGYFPGNLGLDVEKAREGEILPDWVKIHHWEFDIRPKKFWRV